MEGRTIVIDNGAGTCKFGFAGRKEPEKCVPNFSARSKGDRKYFVGDQIDQCGDISALNIRRAFDRGYLTNWEAQKEVWDLTFRQALKVKPSECNLLITEPLFNLRVLQDNLDEIVFEEYGFQSYFRSTAPTMSHRYEAREQPDGFAAQSRCSLVLDAGFSFTHAAPVYDCSVINHAVRRINVGGKVLTNYLKELVSFRSLNVMDESYLMDDVKEKLCFCSLDFERDLALARNARAGTNALRREYVLPDGVHILRGYVKEPARGATAASTKGGGGDGAEGAGGAKGGPRSKKAEEQVLALTNERFAVPEALFHPSDMGVHQAGLAECIVTAVNACPPALHASLYSSILVTGGSTQFPNFSKRLLQELRSLVPDDYKIRLCTYSEPALVPWKGASVFASSQEFQKLAVTKAEYQEHGHLRCQRRFFQ